METETIILKYIWHHMFCWYIRFYKWNITYLSVWVGPFGCFLAYNRWSKCAQMAFFLFCRYLNVTSLYMSLSMTYGTIPETNNSTMPHIPSFHACPRSKLHFKHGWKSLQFCILAFGLVQRTSQIRKNRAVNGNDSIILVTNNHHIF